MDAFSLIEILGVLTIVAILATILTPRVISGIDREARETETFLLEKLHEGLERYVRSTHSLPGTNNWASAIASRNDLNTARVSQNRRGNARRLLVSTNFWSGASPQTGMTQTVQGWPAPVQPRYLIVSSLDTSLPTGTMDFDAMWNRVAQTPLSSLQGWEAWTGRDEDVLIEHIDLATLFHQIVLHNDSGQVAGYTVDGVGALDGTPQNIGDPFSGFWLITSSQLRLFNPDDTFFILEVVTEGRSYYYHQDSWRRSPSPTMLPGAGWLSPVGELLIEWFYAHGHTSSDLELDVKQKSFTVRTRP